MGFDINNNLKPQISPPLEKAGNAQTDSQLSNATLIIIKGKHINRYADKYFSRRF